jgi:AraC-like DNA-binding protein
MEMAQRVVVLSQGVSAAVIESGTAAEPACAQAQTIVASQWQVLHVEQGHGWVRGATFAGRVGPGTLLSLPPGRTTYELEDGKITLLSMREPAAVTGSSTPFSFGLIRQLSRFEQRRWEDRLAGAAHAIVQHGFAESDALALRDDLAEMALLRGSDAAHQTVHDALHLMWHRLEHPVRLEALAAELGYSANYLNDLSRTTTGRSLGRWLADMRMSRARSMLNDSEVPIAEAGLRSGYDDPAYFSRIFRRVHGVAPGEWRIAHRPNDPRHPEIVVPIDALKETESAMAISM